MTKKKRYKVFANGEDHYTYSNNSTNAYRNIFRRLKKHIGFCTITDMRVETSKDVYVKISWNHPPGMG
jgi:hypothetical protein